MQILLNICNYGLTELVCLEFVPCFWCCRRQVFWISKQILQLMMEDAIDDWLLMQIHWLRREDTIAQGIRWIQDVSF